MGDNMNKEKPTVTYNGSTYKLKSNKIEIPDLQLMSNLAALVWINQNTIARGYTKKEDIRIGGFDLV